MSRGFWSDAPLSSGTNLWSEPVAAPPETTRNMIPTWETTVGAKDSVRSSTQGAARVSFRAPF
jgi:hypothetical protein